MTNLKFVKNCVPHFRGGLLRAVEADVGILEFGQLRMPFKELANVEV